MTIFPSHLHLTSPSPPLHTFPYIPIHGRLRVGASVNTRSPPLGGGAFLLFFPQVGAYLLHFSPDGELFTMWGPFCFVCLHLVMIWGGLVCHYGGAFGYIFSMWGTYLPRFSLFWELFYHVGFFAIFSPFWGLF